MEILLQSLIFAIASFLHGITGMAFPMIGTISLAMIYPLPKAIFILAIPSLIINLIVLVFTSPSGILNEIIFYLKKYGLLIVCSVIGSVVGVKLLISLPISLMYLVMGVITLYYVFTEYFSQKRWIKKIQVPTDIKSTIFLVQLQGLLEGQRMQCPQF